MDLRDKRETYNGFGETLARGVELVVTPLLFGLGGHLLDRWLGTGAVFTLVLFALAIVGMAVRSYYEYDNAMKTHEEAAPWRTRRVAGKDGRR